MKADKKPAEKILQLDDSLYVASGVERHVYFHPTDKTKLLKVMRTQEDQGKRLTFRDITTQLFPSVRIRLIRKEYDEYIRIQLKNSDPETRLPITHMFGLTQTNIGLACVTECIRGEQTPVGETLSEKIRHKNLTDTDITLLNDLVDRFYKLGIRAGDMKPHNLVFGYRDDDYECVLVDGFGDIHAIPVRSLGHWVNNIGLNDSFKIVARRTGLIWNNQKRYFCRQIG